MTKKVKKKSAKSRKISISGSVGFLSGFLNHKVQKSKGDKKVLNLWDVCISGTTSVVLKEVNVPTMVQNGTVTHVILDCIYGLNHSEKDGMILKWYFNGKTIFQWIPPSKPKVPFIAQKYKCKVKVGYAGA